MKQKHLTRAPTPELCWLKAPCQVDMKVGEMRGTGKELYSSGLLVNITFINFCLNPESPLEGMWQPLLQSRCPEYKPFATQMWGSLCFLAFGSLFCPHLFSSMDRVKGSTSRAMLLPQAIWCSWDWIFVFFSPYWPCFNLPALWLF